MREAIDRRTRRFHQKADGGGAPRTMSRVRRPSVGSRSIVTRSVMFPGRLVTSRDVEDHLPLPLLERDERALDDGEEHRRLGQGLVRAEREHGVALDLLDLQRRGQLRRDGFQEIGDHPRSMLQGCSSQEPLVRMPAGSGDAAERSNPTVMTASTHGCLTISPIAPRSTSRRTEDAPAAMLRAARR